MGPAAKRLLHVLLGAVTMIPVVILAAAPIGASAAAPPPQPYIVAIDPGHGGSPDDAHPDKLFDPGSVAGNGLVEKDLTLDVSRRVQRRLAADEVKVVMTRNSDTFVSIPDRMDIATAAGAQLFVSIHLNFFQDPSVGGSLVLYPRDSDQPFAQLMADSLARGLQRYDVGGNGTMLRDNLWVHAPMPTVTVEAAYLTNKNEAELLTKDSFKEAIAASVVSGIEAQAPIQARKAEILKYRASHPVASHQVALHVAAPSMSLPRLPHVPLTQLAVLGAMLYLLVRFRRATIPAIALAVAAGTVVTARVSGRQPEFRTRRGVRRRRSRAPLWTGARTY